MIPFVWTDEPRQQQRSQVCWEGNHDMCLGGKRTDEYACHCPCHSEPMILISGSERSFCDHCKESFDQLRDERTCPRCVELLSKHALLLANKESMLKAGSEMAQSIKLRSNALVIAMRERNDPIFGVAFPEFFQSITKGLNPNYPMGLILNDEQKGMYDQMPKFTLLHRQKGQTTFLVAYIIWKTLRCNRISGLEPVRFGILFDTQQQESMVFRDYFHPMLLNLHTGAIRMLGLVRITNVETGQIRHRNYNVQSRNIDLFAVGRRGVGLRGLNVRAIHPMPENIHYSISSGAPANRNNWCLYYDNNKDRTVDLDNRPRLVVEEMREILNNDPVAQEAVEETRRIAGRTTRQTLPTTWNHPQDVGMNQLTPEAIDELMVQAHRVRYGDDCADALDLCIRGLRVNSGGIVTIDENGRPSVIQGFQNIAEGLREPMGVVVTPEDIRRRTREQLQRFQENELAGLNRTREEFGIPDQNRQGPTPTPEPEEDVEGVVVETYGTSMFESLLTRVQIGQRLPLIQRIRAQYGNDRADELVLALRATRNESPGGTIITVDREGRTIVVDDIPNSVDVPDATRISIPTQGHQEVAARRLEESGNPITGEPPLTQWDYDMDPGEIGDD